jgi:hypothetical protein
MKLKAKQTSHLEAKGQLQAMQEIKMAASNPFPLITLKA